jgi:hypothetical protein
MQSPTFRSNGGDCALCNMLSFQLSISERRLLAQSCRSQECPLGEQRKTYARIDFFRCWQHFSDMARCPLDVRFVQQSGRYEAGVSDVPDDLSVLVTPTSLYVRGDQLPKQWLLRPISIAAACWLLVAAGFPRTAETASHLVGAFSRSPAHPVNIKANSSAAKILIRSAYP